MVIAAACGDRVLVDPTAVGAPNASFARIAQSAVCHATGGANYVRLSVPAQALAGHRAHGDALPGEAVPGMPGFRFDANCTPEPTATDLTGEWAGTYSWDCGGTLSGSTAIGFVLDDPGTGLITGTVSYLGGSSTVSNGYRMADALVGANGMWVGGPVDADGMYVRLTWDGSAGSFVNNHFDGAIAPDFNSISGHTLNGDSSPWAGEAGCSAATGYAGTFSVTRVN